MEITFNEGRYLDLDGQNWSKKDQRLGGLLAKERDVFSYTGGLENEWNQSVNFQKISISIQ